MKILEGMLPDYWGGCIPLWICTHGYEEVRNNRKTLFIQSIVENGWWGGVHLPHLPPPWIRPCEAVRLYETERIPKLEYLFTKLCVDQIKNSLPLLKKNENDREPFNIAAYCDVGELLSSSCLFRVHKCNKLTLVETLTLCDVTDAKYEHITWLRARIAKYLCVAAISLHPFYEGYQLFTGYHHVLFSFTAFPA